MDQKENQMFGAPVIGFVRYSQKIAFGESGKVRDMFEPEYFEYRFNIFKNVTLKSFQQQTNNNFVLLLLHSENMPPLYKERFRMLEKTNSFLFNVFVEDNQESFIDAILNSVKYVAFENGTAVTFRIDNDDAVQSDFIQKLSRFLKDDFVGYCVSIPTLYRVKRIAKQLYMMEEFYFPANAIGLASITSKKAYKTILEFGEHDLINNKNDMIMLASSTGGGLMTINGENAINSINKEKSVILNKEDLDKLLKQRKIENLDLDCLRIFTEKNNLKESVFKNVTRLFIPPAFILMKQKIRSYFFHDVI